MATDLDPNEEAAGVLWAEIHRLRAAVQGPDGYETWQQAAVAERVRRVKAEAALKQPDPTYLSQEWLYRYAQEAAYSLNGHSYTPKTVAEAKRFWPHQWVCEAIAPSRRRGFRNWAPPPVPSPHRAQSPKETNHVELHQEPTTWRQASPRGSPTPEG